MKISTVVAATLIASASFLSVPTAMQAQEAAPAEAAATPAAPAPNAQIVAFVDYQYPTADANGDSTLTAEEFTTWISGLKSAELKQAGQPDDPAAVKTYAEGALRTADADADKILTKAELIKFFGG